MARTRAATDRLSARILRRVRAEMVAAAERELGGLDAIYAQVAADVQSDIQGVTSRAEIEAIARVRMNAALAEALSIIQAGVTAAAVAGARTPAETFAAVFPDATAPRFGTQREAQRAAADVLRGRIRARDVPIARRLNQNHQAFISELGREVEQSLQAGETSWNTMERILEVRQREGVVADMPRYIERLREAAHIGGDKLQEELRAAEAYARRLGSLDRANTSMRAGTEELIKRLRRANAEDIDAAVARWLEDKAQYQAKVIARHERNEAHRTAYQRSMRDKPWVKGFKWALSPSHPKPDICDLLANQNLHGLGPGGYPPDAVPATPHPGCTCTQTAIIDQMNTERELAELEGTPPPPETWNVGGEQTAAEWLATQPEALQRQVLGPTRLEAFRADPARVLEADGSIRPVRDVLSGAPRAVAAASRSASPAASARMQMLRASIFEGEESVPPSDITREEWGQLTSEALGAHGSDGGAKARRVVRAMVRGDSRRMMNVGTSASQESMLLEISGEAGGRHMPTGRVVVGSRVVELARLEAAELAAGRTPTGYGIQTMLHEEIHGLGSRHVEMDLDAFMAGDFVGTRGSVAIEEVITETHTRGVMSRVLGVDRPMADRVYFGNGQWDGAYDDYMQIAYEAADPSSQIANDELFGAMHRTAQWMRENEVPYYSDPTRQQSLVRSYAERLGVELGISDPGFADRFRSRYDRWQEDLRNGNFRSRADVVRVERAAN